MNDSPDKLQRLLKAAVQVSVALVVCWGFVLVLAQIKPFWGDEWRLLYNLKFKPLSAMFGPLEFTQQFPRVYLALLKCFTAPFDYSYFTLRLPAFLTGIASMVAAFRLVKRLYGTGIPERYLFPLIIISSSVFLKYLVQVKQYEMEIFLSLLAMLQLLSLADIINGKAGGKWHYPALCLSFIIAPFFSYTYPIAVAPVFLLVAPRVVKELRTAGAARIRLAWMASLPLLLCAGSIVLFYRIDVSQVMKDSGMNCFWQDHMIGGGSGRLDSLVRNGWAFLGTPGSGGFFQAVFSVLGLCAFLVALCAKSFFRVGGEAPAVLLRRYSVWLLLTVTALFMAGRLPLGVARLNAFAFPALALLIAELVLWLKPRQRLLARGVAALLFAGLFGNLLSTIVQTFTDETYGKAVTIYSNTEDAIIYAQAHHLPIVITPAVGYPDDITNVEPCLQSIDAASVLKTFPAYKERYRVPVFGSSNAAAPALPVGVGKGIVGDGVHYQVVRQ